MINKVLFLLLSLTVTFSAVAETSDDDKSVEKKCKAVAKAIVYVSKAKGESAKQYLVKLSYLSSYNEKAFEFACMQIYSTFYEKYGKQVMDESKSFIENYRKDNKENSWDPSALVIETVLTGKLRLFVIEDWDNVSKYINKVYLDVKYTGD